MAIICDNHINVQEIFCEILTHTFVPAFSGTHGIVVLIKVTYHDTGLIHDVIILNSPFAACQPSENIQLDLNTPYELSSPNYPQNYPANANCVWQIRAPESTTQRVRAHFNFLFLEDGVDFLYVGTGLSEGNYNKLSYTGMYQIPLDVISTGDLLVITFESSAAIGAQGFSIRFEAVDPPGKFYLHYTVKRFC